MEFRVEIKNKNIFKKIDEYAEEIGKTKPLLKIVSRRIMNVIDENFETEGKNTGEKWDNWSDIWIEKRKKLGKSDGKILNLDGYLRRSISRYVSDNKAVIGSPLKYAAIHNFGGDIKRGKKTIKMSQREYMRIDRVEEERILDDLKEYYLKLRLKKIKN